MVTRAQIDHARPDTVVGMANSWKKAAAGMVTAADSYQRSIQNPGGLPWSGQTADATIKMAGEDHQAVSSLRQAIDSMADTTVNSINDSVIPNLNDVRAKIASAEAAGFTVNDDLSVTYPATRPPDPKKKEDAERWARDIQGAAQKWWNSDQSVADQINRDKGGLPTKFNMLGALNASAGRGDGHNLVDGTMSQDEQQRLIAAGTLSADQLAALQRGEKVDVGPARMAYLYQLAQSLNGKSAAEIAAMEAQLPPEARAAFAQGMAIVSNHNALSGVPNSDGATDQTRDTFIPAAGSLANLPSGVASELTRTDRVQNEPSKTIATGTMFPATLPATTTLNGVGGLQDVADIFKPADGAYLNGSEATKSMLDAASQYAAADGSHRSDAGSQLVSDQRGGGSDPRTALADVIQVAANDHVGVHDLATDDSQCAGTDPQGRVETNGDRFLRGLTSETWGDQSSKVGDAFRWTGLDPHNAINSETASEVAHYLSEHKVDLQHMPGGGTFGSVNGGLLQAMADGTAPYMAQLAGYSGDSGFTAPGIERFTSEDAMRDMFSVFDQDHQAGTTVNNAALQQQQFLELTAAQNGIHGNEIEVATRLGEAMSQGAIDAKDFGQANHQWEVASDNARAGTAFDTGYGALTALAGLVPGGQLPAAALSVLGPEFKSELLPDSDPTLITGDDYFTDQLSQGRFNNTTDNYATALQGLINAHPEIAADPNLAPFLNGNNVTVGELKDADTTLSKWFADNAEQYGYDPEDWSAQRIAGRDNNNWSH